MATAMRSKFSKAARKCKGKTRTKFRACMRTELKKKRWFMMLSRDDKDKIIEEIYGKKPVGFEIKEYDFVKYDKLKPLFDDTKGI